MLSKIELFICMALGAVLSITPIVLLFKHGNTLIAMSYNSRLDQQIVWTLMFTGISVLIAGIAIIQVSNNKLKELENAN